MIRITPFGGCGLHNPLAHVYKGTGDNGIFAKMGFRNTPFSLSANTNHQLIDYVTGQVDFPDWIRSLAYADGETQPSEEQGKLIFSGDVAIVEMSTPAEFSFGGALLNINRFEEVIVSSLSDLASERKLIGRWKGALRRANEDVRKQASEEIYHFMPKNTQEQRNLAEFVRGTSSRMLGLEDMTTAIANLRDRLAIPMGLVLYNFNYMPNGTPVSWPADFKENIHQVALRLNMPTVDTADFVAREGVANVMMDDRRHWRPSAFRHVGEILYDFCATTIGAPPLAESLPVKLKAKAHPKQVVLAEAAAPREVVAPAAKDAKDVALRREGSAPSTAVAPASRLYAFDHNSGGYLPDDGSTIFAVIVLGGAWAQGANADLTDTAVSVAAEHPRNALTFDTGPRPRGRDVHRFIDLVERTGGSSKETPCAGMADQIMRNSKVRFGNPPKMLFFSISRGGTSLSGVGQTAEDGLLRGAVQHREVMRLIGRAREIAAERKCRLEVAAVCLMHGEYEASRNVSGSAYRRGLSLLQQQYDGDIRALTGQSEPVRLYLTQTNRGSARFETPDLPIAQLNAKYDNPYVQCVGPVYFAPPEVRPEGAAAYVKAAGYRRIGQLFGRFLIDDLWGAQREPLRVDQALWVGPKTIRLRYNRPVALEEDDARVNISDLGPGLGIDFNDGTPWSPTVEALRPVRGREAEIDVELTAPSAGYSKRLLIAARTTGGGGVGSQEGARSGIRSKEPFDVDPLDGAELFDWACTEQVILP
jgi:hypothetical protein